MSHFSTIKTKIKEKPILLEALELLQYDAKENQDLVNKKKDELNKKNIEIKTKFTEIAKLVNKKTFIFNRESKENGDLYGTIKPKEITNLIKEKLKADVSPSQIVLKVELNKIGLYEAIVNFHAEVQSKFSIKIDKIKSK